jgi:hypothetical protein
MLTPQRCNPTLMARAIHVTGKAPGILSGPFSHAEGSAALYAAIIKANATPEMDWRTTGYQSRLWLDG